MREELICPHCRAIQKTHEPDQISAGMYLEKCEKCGRKCVLEWLVQTEEE